jgi:hypothetical protein
MLTLACGRIRDQPHALASNEARERASEALFGGARARALVRLSERPAVASHGGRGEHSNDRCILVGEQQRAYASERLGSVLPARTGSA